MNRWNDLFFRILPWAQPIYDEQVEYDSDETQILDSNNKDVATFLSWSSYPIYDERKKEENGNEGTCFIGLIFPVLFGGKDSSGVI
jgi:hypothetical protein